MGVSNILGAAFKPIAKLVGSIAGGGEDKPSAAANNTVTNKAESDAAANQGRLNPLIFTSPNGVLDPANPGKKLLIGQ